MGVRRGLWAFHVYVGVGGGNGSGMWECCGVQWVKWGRDLGALVADVRSFCTVRTCGVRVLGVLWKGG